METLNPLWALATYGLTLIVTESKIMLPVRQLGQRVHPKIGQLLHCPMCFGFWAGGLLYIADLTIQSFFFACFRHALIGSALCWILRVCLHRLGSDTL